MHGADDGHEADFDVVPARHSSGTVLAVSGEFDLATAPGFADAVQAELAAPPAVLVIDLTRTAFADSSACRELVRAARATSVAGSHLEVVCPTGNVAVRRVLDLVGLGSVTPLRECLAETAVAQPPVAQSAMPDRVERRA